MKEDKQNGKTHNIITTITTTTMIIKIRRKKTTGKTTTSGSNVDEAEIAETKGKKSE